MVYKIMGLVVWVILGMRIIDVNMATLIMVWILLVASIDKDD